MKNMMTTINNECVLICMLWLDALYIFALQMMWEYQKIMVTAGRKKDVVIPMLA